MQKPGVARFACTAVVSCVGSDIRRVLRMLSGGRNAAVKVDCLDSMSCCTAKASSGRDGRN